MMCWMCFVVRRVALGVIPRPSSSIVCVSVCLFVYLSSGDVLVFRFFFDGVLQLLFC
jgi:hypothetical protein